MELAGEALVSCPEQPDVIDGKFDHGQALKAQPKGPCLVALPSVAVQYLLLHHPVARQSTGQLSGCAGGGTPGNWPTCAIRCRSLVGSYAAVHGQQLD